MSLMGKLGLSHVGVIYHTQLALNRPILLSITLHDIQPSPGFRTNCAISIEVCIFQYIYIDWVSSDALGLVLAHA